MIGVLKRNDLLNFFCKDTTLDFCISSIIIVVMDCCMPIDKMIKLIKIFKKGKQKKEKKINSGIICVPKKM